MTDSRTREAFEAWFLDASGGRQNMADYRHWANAAWQAARRAALEEAERACKDVRDEGDSFKKHEDNHDDGHMDGCNNCAAAIRALADETQEG